MLQHRTSRRTLPALFLLAALAGIAPVPDLVSGAEPAAPAKVGEAVRQLAFKDIRFVTRTLKSFGEKKAFVLVLLSTTCPVAGRYAPRLNALSAEYAPRGVQFVGINSCPDDTLLEMAADALERKVAFPVHKDFDQSVLRAVGATRTPEAAVLDSERILRYRGRIDEDLQVAGASPRPGRAHLREALDAVLAGREPEVKETPVEGCLVTPRRPAELKGITYSEHIAPILQRHCQECHRPEQPAPFPLLAYEDAAGRAAMIREVVSVSHYDNSPWNPFNPDPSATVREGQQTFQEMNYGFLFYVDANERLEIDVDPRTGRPLEGRTARL